MEFRFGSLDKCRKFVITIPATTWSYYYLYIPHAFVSKYKDEIPDEVVLHFRNGDVFGVKFNRHCGCFVGVSKIFDRYGLNSCSSLFVEFRGVADFYVCITNSTSVEIEYPVPAYFHYLPKLTVGCVPIEPPTVESAGVTLLDDINHALFSMSSLGNRNNQLEFQIDKNCLSLPECMVLPSKSEECNINFVHQQQLLLQLKERQWSVEVQKGGSHTLLTKGWLKFVSELGLAVGDVCVLEPMLEGEGFLVGLYKDFYNCVARLQKGLYMPSMFMKTVGDGGLVGGQIYVPFLFSEVYLHSIPLELMLLMEDGSSFKVNYDRRQCAIVGLTDFLSVRSDVQIQVILFQYVGNGVFHVSMFNKDGVDIFMSRV